MERKKLVGVLLTQDEINRIDEERKYESRSSFLRRLIKRILKI